MGSAARSRLAAGDGHADCGTSRIRAGRHSRLIAFRPGGRSEFRRCHRTSLHDVGLRAVLRWVLSGRPGHDRRARTVWRAPARAELPSRPARRHRVRAWSCASRTRSSRRDSISTRSIGRSSPHRCLGHRAVALELARACSRLRRPAAGCCRRTRPPTTRTSGPHSREREKPSKSHCTSGTWAGGTGAAPRRSPFSPAITGRMAMGGRWFSMALERLSPRTSRRVRTQSSLCVSRPHQPLDSAYLQSISCTKA